MPHIVLNPLSESAYRAWLTQATAEYAAEKVKAGAWLPEEALEHSRKDYERLLPAGVATPDQYLYTIHDQRSGEDVGVLWFADQRIGLQRIAFVYEVQVFEQFRRRGYARAGMLALEEKVRELGIEKMALHVFGGNEGALALYLALGYQITDYNMAKSVR
jgi:GNAT superfamily N-acetyltransferase